MTNTPTRRLILIACFVIASTSTYAQNVTAKDDEFSGKRTVTMSAQRLTPTLTLTLKRLVDTTRRTSFYETDLAFVQVEFISTTGKREYGAKQGALDGYELNFLVDGERVSGRVRMLEPTRWKKISVKSSSASFPSMRWRRLQVRVKYR